MKIFFLGYSLEQGAGGIENYTHSVLSYLKSIGHEITVFTLEGENQAFNNITIKKPKILRRFLLHRRILKTLKSTEKEFDLLLCGHLFLTPIMEKVSRHYAFKYDLFVYGIDCWAGRFKERYPSLQCLDKVISISSFTSEQIKEQGFEGQIVYLPPLIDHTKYTLNKVPNRNNIVTFLTVGRLSSQERYKGHEKVIQAVALLVADGLSNIKYLVAGKGDDLDFLKDLTKSLGVETFVEFLGYVPDASLSDIYNKSDVFIMPSNVKLDSIKPEGEGFGIVYTEAGIHGLPLIGPDQGGSTDIINDGVNGLECNPNSPPNIADKMRILIEDIDKREAYGKQAQLKVSTNFTMLQMERYLEKWLSRN